VRRQAELEREVLWQPNDGPQTDFLSTIAREVLYGGAAGGGKSDALLGAANRYSADPLHRAIIFRRTFPMLKDLIERSRQLYAPLGAHYRENSAQWRFPSGAIIEFGYLDQDKHKYIYQGRAFTFIGFDELTQWPGDTLDNQGKQVNGSYVYLISRLRAVTGTKILLMVRSTTNPGGIGHGWVQERWQIPDEGTPSELIDKATGYRREFIPARISDNPFLHGTSYEHDLDALNEADRKALKEGRWDSYEGAVFREWNPRVHVCDPFKIPDEWERWRGGDDGFNAPACVLWFARDQANDRIYIYNEIYERGLRADVLAEKIIARDNGRGLGGILDSAAFAELGNLTAGRGKEMNLRHCRWHPCTKGPEERVAGKQRVHDRLAIAADGLPKMQIFRNCKNLIRTLPTLPSDPRKPEDVDTKAEDHAYDALRYGLEWRETRARRVRVVGI
jgi:Terminase large subunit, T4likevirus-type, N-terminal